ncbi:hypothetical protein PUN28_019101 [Cardiocondyla obscurior]|uniref:Photosystem II protein I n=1 Tax=Cardiocondyla obscurior TaxID=286306 RepID=A0AAW2EHA1_9HYME
MLNYYRFIFKISLYLDIGGVSLEFLTR